MARIAIVGAGMMGEALARGMLSAGWAPTDIVMSDVRADRLEELKSGLGVAIDISPASAVSQASQGVMLAVKPQDAPAALRELAEVLRDDHVLLSIAAGLRIKTLREYAGPAPFIVRVMPNTPARVGKGVTALCCETDALTDREMAAKTFADDVFSSVGPVVWLEEDHLDAVTAVSGSGPAYVFYLAEAMMLAASELGLDPADARTLVASTIAGAGAMLVSESESPEQLRAQVTSKGGTTAAAISVFDSREMRGLIVDAVRAAWERSRELGS